ncbi:peroxisomal ATPase PEX6 isoform X2 [Palaemon carinicauda]
MDENQVARRGLCDLAILLYVCSLLKATRPHIRNPLVYATKVARGSCTKVVLKVLKHSLKSFHRKVKPNGVEYDLNSVVLVSPKTAFSLSVKNCQWVNANFHTRCYEDHLKQVCDTKNRWIVFHVSPEIPDDLCMVSPILYYNVVKNQHNVEVTVELTNDFQYCMSSAFQRVLVLWHNANSKEPLVCEDTNFQSSPRQALEVQVKFVESLHYKCGNYIDKIINDYFSLPKAVTFDDVLVIPLPSHLAYEFAHSNCIIPPKYIFIKICSVKGKDRKKSQQTMLVRKNVTSLYLSGALHCTVPSLTETIQKDGKVKIPPVLDSIFCRLKFVMEMERSRAKNLFDFDASFQVCTECNDKSEVCSPCTPMASSTITKERDSLVTESVASASVLFIGPPGNGIEEAVNFSASDFGLEVLWIDSWHLKGDTSGTTEARLRQTFLRASTHGHCILALKNVHCIAKDNDGNDDGRVVGALKEEMIKLQQSNVVVVGITPQRSLISADLWSIWSHQEIVEVPDLLQRSLMFDWLFSLSVPKDKIRILAQRTAGYIYGDFQALYVAAQRLCLYRLFSNNGEIDGTFTNISNDSPPVTYKDILQALDELQSNRSEALGAPRIPQVQWKDVGGLEEAKREVVNTIQLPLRHPTLVSSGLRRSGVLLYGPPGTGKTLLAKAVATECGLNFMSVKGPELLNMYVGQSEENVRQVFARAKAAAPCVIFFDELDSLAPNRGRSGDSGGVMDRIVSALLAELDGVASTADVFVMAATNRPDLIDPALLRPGRFEKMVFLGVCEDRAGQVKVLRAVTSKVPLDKDVVLERVAELLPLTLTGADLYSLCTDALYTALHRTIQHITEGKVKEEEGEILVTEEDFKVAIEQLVPSVTPKELIRYQNLKTNQR